MACYQVIIWLIFCYCNLVISLPKYLVLNICVSPGNNNNNKITFIPLILWLLGLVTSNIPLVVILLLLLPNASNLAWLVVSNTFYFPSSLKWLVG